MKRYNKDVSRDQGTLFPDHLEDWIGIDVNDGLFQLSDDSEIGHHMQLAGCATMTLSRSTSPAP